MCALSKSWDVRWIVPHKIMYGAPVLEDLNNRPVKQSENIVNLSGTYFGYLDSWSPEANFKKFTEALFLRWLKITRWMCIFRQMQSCLDVMHHQLRSSKCTGFQIHVKDAIELKVANRYKFSTSNIVDEEKTFTGSLVLDSRIDEVTCIHPIVDYLFSRNSGQIFNSWIYTLIKLFTFWGFSAATLTNFVKTSNISDSVEGPANGSFEANDFPKPIIALWLGITACFIQSVTIG